MLTRSRPRLLFVLAFALGSLLLSGCFGGRLVIRPFPKRPVVVRTAAPGADHFWVDGHWRYDDGSGRYVWVKGRWVTRVSGKRWVPGHYKVVRRGRARIKVWVPGHWKGGKKKVVVVGKKTSHSKAPAVVVKPAPATVVVRDLPPLPRVVKPQRPRGNVVWVKGYFRWDAGRKDYVWVSGRWVVQKPNKRWVPGHYKVERRGALKVRIWVPGHWVAGGGGAAPHVATPKTAARIIAMNPPAAPRIKKPRRPGRAYVWVSGHHVWNPRSNSYTWRKGHWVKQRPGKRWTKGHYKVKVLGSHRVKVWIPGHWQ